jgi:hypothetical protein
VRNEPVLVQQPWYCQACGADATYAHYSDVDSGLVKAGVLEQHRKLRPECTATDIGPIRFRDREREKTHGR